MKLETFFEKFDQFADAPDAVGKVRELVFESAIRGNLVTQSANDEPASELITRLEADFDSQYARPKKRPSLPPVGDDAYLHLPPSWSWIRLGNTGRIFNGDSVSESGKAELAKVEDGLPFIATKDVGYGRDALAYDNGLKVPLGDPRFKIAKAHAVLICAEGGSAGRKIGITNRDICFGNKLYANEVREGIHHRFIFYVYQAPTFYKQFASRMTGIIGGIARSEFLLLPIPLPPEEEQKRIVAKVDELMALCDRLEAQQQERAKQDSALARAALARFADAPTPANLDFLFHKSYDITPADLRKSILTLAVQGKLVPQDPTDEPAEASFPKLAEAGVESNDDAFPAHWLRVPLGKMGEWRGGGTPSKSRPEFWKGDLPWVSPKDMKVLHIADAQDHISPAAVEGSSVRLIPPGSLLMVVRGMILARAFPVALTTREVTINQDMKALLPSEPKTKEYLLVALRAFELDVLAAIEHSSHGTCKLKTEFLQDFVMPIPPLAEQRRIVAKVEQLMALVDALETQLAASRATGEKLLAAIVAELTAGKESHAAA